MNGNNNDWLPLLLLLTATAVALQSELRHATCDNEERYENQMMCVGKAFGCLVPYPDNCSLFLVCDCIYPTVKRCPANLWWDNKTQGCNYAQLTECNYYTFTTETSPIPEDNTTYYTDFTTTTEVNWPTSDWDPPPVPPGIKDTFCRNYKDGSVHRYPYDCNAYINCTHSWPVLNYCDPDKVFNDELKICDTPETAHCEPLPLPSTTTSIPATTTTMQPTTTTPEDETCGPHPEFIEEDYCLSKGNGFYVYPYDCSYYIVCRNGCTSVALCPTNPEKLFNRMLHICDTPNSVKCNPEPYPVTTVETTKGTTVVTSTTAIPSTTVATTTTSAPTTLPPDVNPNACKNYPDDTRLPYAGNCSQYLLCENGQVILEECFKGMLFNPDFGICDEADDVICYGDRTTTTTSTTPLPTTVTVPTTTPAGPAELCKGQQQGDSFPYTEDCSKYILCLGDGIFYIAPCAGGYYDPKSKACGPNVPKDACKAKDTTTPTTTVATTTTELVTPSTPTTSNPEEPIGICGGLSKGEMIPYPKDCSKYIVCVSPIPVAFYCQQGFYFSEKRQQCVSWEESDCDGEISTTPGYTLPPPKPTICTNSSRDTFPYPESCHWFIRCVNDYVYMIDVCDYDEYYDPIEGVCGRDVPHDACHWDYTSTTTPEPTTVSTTAVTRPPPQKGPCDDAKEGELVPYPDDCSKYIKCNRPIPSAIECPDGEEFSPVERKCMDALWANCYPDPTPYYPSTTDLTTKSPVLTTTPETSTTRKDSTTTSTSAPEISTTPKTTTTEETSTTGKTTAAPPSGICANVPPGNLVPYPNNCSKYIKCDEPIPIGHECPDGLEFSPTKLECMDPDLANCNAVTKPTPFPPYSTTVSTTEEPCTSTPTITDSTTTESTSTIIDTTTPLTTETETTSTITDSTSTITDSTTDSITEEPCTSTPTITDSTTTESTTTTPETTTTIHPNTPNICCGVPLGTYLPYPNDCNRYVVCDYPIPYSVVCEEGTVFDPDNLVCTAEGVDSCM